MAELAKIRWDLAQVLGYNYPRYLKTMAEWFTGKNARDDLELDLSFISDGRCRDLHNRFMKGILLRSLEPDSGTMNTFMDGVGFYDYATELGPEYTGHIDLLQHSSGNCITLHSAPTSQLALPISLQHERLEDDLMEIGDMQLECEAMDTIYFDNDSEPPPKRDLFYVEMTRFSGDSYKRDEEDKGLPAPKYDSRLPVSFIQEFTQLDDPKNSLDRFMVPHKADLHNVEKWTQKEPRLGKFFPLKREADQPLLPSNTSIQGRFLIQAWAKGVKNVHPDAVAFALKATRDHLKKIITALIKQRKAYDLHSGSAVNIGKPYPNSYLRSGPHRVHLKSHPFTSRLVEPVQIPQLVEAAEEHERLSIMRFATSVNAQPRYESKIGCTELLTLIQSDSRIIPSNRARSKLVEKLYLHAKGVLESPMLNSREDEIEFDHEEGELQPVCSY